jgi:hypothetical protein
MIVNVPPGDDDDDAFSGPITPFDTATYIYQLVTELMRIARSAGLTELTRLLEAVRDRAADELIVLGRNAQGGGASGDAA